jgi:SAM-dependent methyltransferase
MASLFSVARQLGLPALLRLRQARRWAWEDIIGPHFVAREIQTLLNVGLLDEMKFGPVDVAAYADKHDLEPELVRGICESLHSRKILKRQGDGFALDDKGRFIVETSLARGWFDLSHGYENVLYNLEPMVRKQMVYGRDLVREGKFVGVGSGLASLDFYFPLVAARLAKSGFRRVLDIGCGDGTFLRYLCRKLPGITAVGLDLSNEAVSAGNETLVRENLSDRIELIRGDATEIERYRDRLKGVDAATTFFVLHELCDNERNPRALEFLRAFRRGLPGVPFHIVETVRPSADEMRRRPGPAVEYFLFHDLSGQRPIGRESWKKLFTESGYADIDEDYISFARTSIYVIR